MEAQHPRTLPALLPEALSVALKMVAQHTPAAVATHRARWFAKWIKVAESLKSEELALKAKMPSEMRKILEPKKLLLWEAILKDSGYCDPDVVNEVIRGFDLTGAVPDSGVFNVQFRPAKLTVEKLVTGASASRKAIVNSTRSQGDTIDKIVLAKTLDEVERGWLSGPIEQGQLPENAIVSRRFGLEQPGKVRLIDDFTASGINLTVQAGESPKPHTVDVAAGMLLEAMRIFPGTHFKGRAYDLVSAYRQFAINPDAKWSAYISVWDHTAGAASIFLLHALPFGASRSVFGFLRAVHSVWRIGCVALWLIWSCYYDDFISLTDAVSEDVTHKTLDALLCLLGWEYATEGPKCQGAADAFCALGVQFVLSDMHLGRVYISNTEKRVNNLLESIKEHLSSGKMTVSQALKIRGKLQYAGGQLFGRLSRTCLSRITEYAYSESPPNLPEECMDAFQSFGSLLSNCKPRTIDCKIASPWHIFTDACYEPERTSWKCGIGGLLFDSVGRLRGCFSFCLSDSHLDALGANKKGTIIMEAEFLALICALQVWAPLIRNAPVTAFVDNNSCRDIIISAKGRSKTVKCLLQHFLRLEHDCGIILWVSRVPSPSNIADEPSRRSLQSISWRRSLVACTEVAPVVNDIVRLLG